MVSWNKKNENIGNATLVPVDQQAVDGNRTVGHVFPCQVKYHADNSVARFSAAYRARS
jgi:hypothetical protein